jgi:hypothetical protein
MSSFDNLYAQQLDEMARSSDVADFSGVPEDFPTKAVPNRGTANRFGRHQNSDVQPFFQAVVQDFLSRDNKKITYAEVSIAIKNILLKSKDRGGMGMGPTFADKWTQHLSDVLFKLLKSVNAASKEPDSNPSSSTDSADKSPINVAPENQSDESPAEEPATDETEEEPSPEEAPEAPEENEETPEIPEDDLEATAGLDLNPDEEAVLDVIKNLGGKEVTNKQIIGDPATPFKLRDDPSKLREVLGKMARVDKVLSRGDQGWNVKEKEPSEDSEAVFDREEDGGIDYGAEDLARQYQSQSEGPRRSNPFLDSFDIQKAYIDSFKSKSRE